MTHFASTAYMLVSHGSRDPRPGQAMERLAQVVTSQIQHQQITATVNSPAVRVALSHQLQPPKPPVPSSADLEGSLNPRHQPAPLAKVPLVATGCLELGLVPLHQQLVSFSQRAAAAGIKTIRVVPLFLLKGVHVMEDIPAEVAQAQQHLPDLNVELCPHLGSHPDLKTVLRQKHQTTGRESLLLLAHGSRRPGGNEAINALARAIKGSAAFWAVAPGLEDQIIQLMQSGVQELTILPYFLFAGKTTDAITHRTEELAERFPQVVFHLLPPLGPTESVADLVTDLALNRVKPRTQKSPLPLKRQAFRHQLPSSLVS